MTAQEEQPRLERHVRNILLWSLGLAAFWVVFLWRFWDVVTHALGLNAALFFAATAALFLHVMRHRGVSLRRALFWLVPVGLIMVSYLLYENPFMKGVSLLALPLAFGAFALVELLSSQAGMAWDSRFLTQPLGYRIAPIGAAFKAAALHGRLFTSMLRGGSTARRAITGVLLFAVIAIGVVIPLLSSADAAFAERMSWLNDWLRALLDTPIFARILFLFVLSVVISAVAMGLQKIAPHPLKDDTGHTDSLVAGIVLGGLLAIYLLFLSVQVERLWMGSLPADFRTSEQLVKGGFWQLLGLTALNVVLYFHAYRRTKPSVQKLLAAFMLASLLLLASAGQRIWLYVTTYGFSYEKFYAAYAVLFCAVLLVWLISRLFAHRRSDILKFAAVLCLWMYGVVAVFPVEQFVLRANVALSRQEGSRINLYELTMLSPDVLPLVRRYAAEGTLSAGDWSPWITRQEHVLGLKRWYEHSVSSAVAGK